MGIATELGTRAAPYLPRLVRGWERAAPGAAARELDGSLVSVDISGFTALSERLAAQGRVGAEHLILAISGVFDALIRIAGARGGDVLKFRGDALLLFFDGAGHERRACIACAEMQAFLESATPAHPDVRLRMRSGVHSGACHFFLAGSTHRELVVTGPAATAVVRLESSAVAGELIASEATVRGVDPAWVRGERDGAFLLEPESPPVDPHCARADAAHDPAGDLGAFVPEPVRRRLAADVLEPEHRQVTAAFLRYSGTDALLADDGADAVAESLQALGAAVGDAAAAFGVTWLESDVDVDGGKLYLVAGAPASAGDDEERMLLALRRVFDAGVPIEVRAGVNRGHAFAGEIGSSTRRTYAVMGDTVNLAARLVGRAAPGEVLATGEVLERAGTQFASEPRPFLVKGKERAVTAFAVGGALGRRGAETGARLELVGRDVELAALRDAVDAARRRERQVIELVGEPGIGKSRLVEELSAAAVGFTQLQVACELYTRAVPYHAFRALLRPLVGITPEQSAADAGAQLGSWVSAVMPDLLPMLPLLAIPFDAEVPSTAEADEVAPAFRRERVAELVHQFMLRVLMLPTLLVVEDTHWLDDASQQLLAHLVRTPTPAPWLLCATRRPEGPPLADTVRTVIELEPLPAQDAARLALQAAAGEALSEDVVQLVSERSGGNPLFVRELAAAAGRGRVDALPDTVESLLTSRIDLLDPGDRLLLRYASVVGPSFDVHLLEEILADEALDPGDDGRWERLAQFVAWDGPDTVRFRHELFRAAAYEGLSFRRRREIHGRLADALVRRLGGRADEAADLLSLHFARAERWDDTWRYASAAARRSQARYANVVAAELYERALEASARLPELDPHERLDVLESLGDVSELFADYDRAAAAYEEARTIAGTEVAAGARLVHKRGVVAERMGRFEEALDWYRIGLERVRGVEAPGEQALLELGISAARHRQARYDESVDWAQHALANAERAGDLRTTAHALDLLHANSAVGGTADTGFAERALPIYEELGDLVGKASVLNNLGVSAYYESRWDEAARVWTESGALSRRAGDVVGGARATNNVGEILSDQGRLREAQELFEDAKRIWRAAHYRLGTLLATSNLGRVAARGREFARAHELLDEALAGFDAIGAVNFVAETRVRVLEALVLEGRYQEALVLVEKLDRASVTTSVFAELERLHGYALHQARRPDEARGRFDESARLARDAGAEYELALALGALADTGAPDAAALAAEASALRERLGVVAVPSPPLP